MTPNFVNWSNSTFYFYLCIPCVCLLLSKLDLHNDVIVSNNIKSDTNLRLGTFMASLILACVKCFSNTGIDVQGGYKFQFFSSNSLSGTSDDTVEIGFRALNFLIYHLGKNYNLLLFIYGLITLMPVIYFITKYNRNIDVGITIFLYSTMFFFQGFSLMRLYLASSIALFSMNDLAHEKYCKSILWLLIAISFHRSTMILLIVIIFYRMKQMRIWVGTLISLIMLGISIVLRSTIINGFSGRYEIYKLQSMSSELGFALLFKYIPLFFLLWYVSRHKIGEKYIKLSYYIILIGFEFDALSYFIQIVGRMQGVFLPIIFIVGYYIHSMKKRSVKMTLGIFFICYGMVQLIMYIRGYYAIDGLMPYTSYLNFAI
ncbi:EpsG family protein [Limosilactobacillus fermentum]|uniref:EpsG family protein n=1 Tax=Limosilactobacillus fermentum TaxID=1613 RepID=UPI000F0D0BCB|nr:EpsG family protein [Limosilactobacillus fermentum]AYP98612.1 EpsG family protein [Limosilactobacillus fermentum]